MLPKRKPYLLVFLMLVFSFSSGIASLAPPLHPVDQHASVLTPPASANSSGFQEGSIFTQATIAIGGEHMCVITDQKSVMCWGNGASGQLGNNDTTSHVSPVLVEGFGPGRTATALSAGFAHTCALLDNGSVTCWGKGTSGQLGDDLSQDSPLPATITALPSGHKAITIASGYDHTCAILDDGSVACWGEGSSGQLGNGALIDSSTPQTTQSLGFNSSAKSISLGRYHSCAITDNGTTVCWGQGSQGQLGNGATSEEASPVTTAPFPFNQKAVALASGEEHTCALMSTGSVACWGNGANGRLGNGASSSASTPELTEPFGGGRTAVAISSQHQHTCALLNDGNVSCWGSDEDGRAGTGDGLSEHNIPTDTAGLGAGRTSLSIAAGFSSTCAILDDLSTVCWGDLNPPAGNVYASTPSELTLLPAGHSIAVSERDFNGNGVLNIFEFPVNFDFTASGLSAGARHTCAILDDDSITCWGDNSKGQLGTGDTVSQFAPISTLSLGAGRTAHSVVAGHTQTCALLDNGSVSCWGEQYLTNDTKVINTSPTLVGDFGNNRTAIQISVGLDFSCAVLNDGNVSCWGRGASGRLGNGGSISSTDPTPTSPFGSGRKAMSVDLYSDHACALLDDASVMCWGNNAYGKLGDGTSAERNTPVQVNAFPTNTTPISVSVGSHHSCALLDIGDVSCWGEGGYGQNGDGTNSDRASPGRTSGFGVGRLAVSVSSGDHHICAMLDSGEVSCWGDGGSGRLGNGASSRTFTPVLTSSFGDGRIATSLSVGTYHGCVVLDSGQISCWGAGADGRLGNGETSNQVSPVLTKTLGPSVSSISAGGDHSCALLGNGSVACWGRGAEGQLGDGNTTNQIAPVFVSSFGSGRTAVAISAGLYHTCALLDNGSVSCWGTGWQGALGNGDPGQQNTPILTSSFGAGRTAVALSAGHGYTCAVLDNGSVACWGDNTYGQLGDGTTQGRFTPVLTDSLGAGRTAIDVTTKESHTCALLDNGSISCWGRGISGVLGNGSSVNQNTPTLVSSLGVGRTAVAVSAGAMHTCAILDNGEVSCWGYGNGGRLGNGVRPDKYTPTLTSTLGSGRTAVAISLGFDHTCAVLDDG